MTDKSDDKVLAFEHHFGPRGREFERSNLQKFKCPGFARGGGGGVMLKFRVDRRIIGNRCNNLCACFQTIFYIDLNILSFEVAHVKNTMFAIP